MAKKTTKKTTKKKAARRKKPKMDFHGQMVLFRWALGKLGVDSLDEFKTRFQIDPNTQGGIGERTGRHRFFDSIANVLEATEGDVLTVDRLRLYEQNLVEHTQAINTARAKHSHPTIEWKYHQYLALLFTELFLDRYFDDPHGLRDELNAIIAKHNDRIGDEKHPDWVAPYPTEPTSEDDGDPKNQLSKLAFWCATGSGKTLLMHMHIHQFKWYHERANRELWPTLDQIILVTPNDGLSDQHAKELTWAGFDVVSVGEAGVDGLYAAHARKAIKILSIHKFRDDHGKSTVATEAFEGHNLVLVDEGHRGAGAGGEGAWLSRRNQLADGGFTFEYSATFKEAVQGDDAMRVQYARSILFDYAYRSFYRDGYGKDFSILNLEDDDKQTRYLTAALLLFYQQMRVWKDGGEQIKPFQIDKPLWVFVGHTVTGGKVSTKDDKVSVSDVVEVLLFIKDFLSNQSRSTELIQDLIENGFIDEKGRDLLAHRLEHIQSGGDPAKSARDIHSGILSNIFNAPSGGTLTVQLLRDATGELALRVGDSEPFGVVNVGEPGAVADMCEVKGIVKLEDDQNRSSLFKGINHNDSTVNLLVGSRKFTEGWNSWRVSSIGLMNMGKGEGTQIIQLFGRGVRLRGYKMSLRRSYMLAQKPNPPKGLRQAETLQVFGIQANYINQFRDWIFSEVPEAQERQVWDLPVVKTLPKHKLRTLQIKNEIEGVQVERGQAFRKLGPLVRLRPPSETDPKDDWIRAHPTRLNWLPKVRGIKGEDKEITGKLAEVDTLPTQKLSKIPICFFDLDELLFKLEAFKANNGLDRLYADRRAIRQLLESDHWYTLHATDADMQLNRYENRLQWQRMAQQLINTYAKRFYDTIRARWEAPYLEVAEIDDENPNLIDSYTIEGEGDLEKIQELIVELREMIDSEPLKAWSKAFYKWRTVPFAGHLYQPLFCVGKNTEIRISPVSLDEGEARFVEDLARWCADQDGLEVYLLRNQAKSGLGFMQASNFYPDFLMWVKSEELEHLIFVEPHGLIHEQPHHPKVQFANEMLPDIERTIAEHCTDLRLHAFILSTTPYMNLNWANPEGNRYSQSELEELGVLFPDNDQTQYLQKMMACLAPSPR
ncbi:MAG: DEAD/DEAH box helicase family protein [Phycisphaerales bacterium JB052]